MTNWISFAVAFGVVAPWLLAGACLLAEWACKAVNHGWRMRTDPMYREVEIRFRAECVEAGLDGRTIPVMSILWWSSAVATACLLSLDVGWLIAMRWLWTMSAPLIALEFAAILVAAVCCNLTAVSFIQRVGARSDPMDHRPADGDGDWDDLLRAAEALSAQYDAIADYDHRREGE